MSRSKKAHNNSTSQYKTNSITLVGAVSMGTAVIIGAGIFALTGQIAELAGSLFPLAFIVAAIVTAFSAYSYIKLSNAFPSAGGIAMFLKEAYGSGTITAAGALLMYFSMVINESLVARTFGTYVMRVFSVDNSGVLISVLGVFLLIFAFIVNISGNRFIGKFSLVMSVLKIGGITLFGIVGLWLAGFSFESLSGGLSETTGATGFLAGVALAILAYKGFTTITNSGSEITNPHRNVGRAIIIALSICVFVYFIVALAVSSNLSIAEISQSKNFVLAEAARPALGDLGVGFTVFLAIIATISGVIASTFAVSRMLAMLTDMKLVPHNHFRMPGSIQQHTLVYTILIAISITVFFDLGRIASLGAILYLIMDILVHWGVLKNLREKINANSKIVVSAILLDLIVLTAFLIIKAQSDMLVIYASGIAIVSIVFFEKYYLQSVQKRNIQNTTSKSK